MTGALLMLASMLVESLVGWPSRLYQYVRHPVVWMGALISALDDNLNNEKSTDRVRYVLGAVTAIAVIALSTVCGIGISVLLPDTGVGFAAEAIIASSLIATRSLYTHVDAVAKPLAAGDIDAARRSVSHIVGRDTSQLDATGISRASLESLAENSSDGVVAPIFWGVLFGLPGIAAYKAVNTLDSMIGHMSPRHRAFGWASAKLDDLANFIPARLTAAYLIAASGTMRAIRTVFADAGKHRSPNAGWPESALAGSVGIRLSGPRLYGGELNKEPWLNGSSPDPDARSLRQGLRLYVGAMALVAVTLLMLAAIGSLL